MAAVDYFLKIEKIPGESAKEGHKDEIELLSWSWGQTNSGSHAGGSGGGVGKVVMNDFSFSMVANKASPELFLYCATGKSIGEATLVCREAGGKQLEYLKIKFSDLVISTYQTGGSGGEIKPVESISFNFARIDFSYAQQETKGGGTKPWITKWYNQNETTFG